MRVVDDLEAAIDIDCDVDEDTDGVLDLVSDNALSTPNGRIVG